jgi:hypothetical protein
VVMSPRGAQCQDGRTDWLTDWLTDRPTDRRKVTLAVTELFVQLVCLFRKVEIKTQCGA